MPFESMPTALKRPRLEVLPSKEGAGKHIVWLYGPDGDVQQVDDFASEADAKLWIKNDFEEWLKKHPKNMSSQRISMRLNLNFLALEGSTIVWRVNPLSLACIHINTGREAMAIVAGE